MSGDETHRLFDDPGELHPSDHIHRRRDRKRRDERRKRFVLPTGILPTLLSIANVDFLLYVFDEMRRSGGKAPGLDQLRYEDFSRSEIADAFRKVVKAILDGTYRPHPYRSVWIDKEDGTQRELRLRNIIDRVVAGAIYRVLIPYFEPRFLGCSYGFRANPEAWTADEEMRDTFNTLRLLAEYEEVVNQERLYVAVIDDVRKAFDNVNIDLVMSILAKHIADVALLRLIETVLRGGDDRHNIGIDQGSPLSPLILNILLDEVHDKPLNKEEASPPNFRYADNLLNACETVEGGNQTLERVRELLAKAGLTLKGKKDGHPVVDLRGEEAQLLGFTLSVENEKLRFGLGKKAWGKLEKSLREAHEARNPASVARQVMIGWVQASGPALRRQEKDATLERVLQTAADLGLHEGTSLEELSEAWKSARRSWGEARREARKRYRDRVPQHPHPGVADVADVACGSATASPPGTAPHAGGPFPQILPGDGVPFSTLSLTSPHASQTFGGSTSTSPAECRSSGSARRSSWPRGRIIQPLVARCLRSAQGKTRSHGIRQPRRKAPSSGYIRGPPQTGRRYLVAANGVKRD